METTCPICSQGIEIDPVTLNALQGTPEFDCPTCGGPVPVPQVPNPVPVPAQAAPSPGPAGPKAIETTCPICAQGIELSMEALQSLRGTSEFDCPTCGGPVPVPGAAKKPAHPSLAVQPAPATAIAVEPPVAKDVASAPEVQSPVPAAHSQPSPPAQKAPIPPSVPALAVARDISSASPAQTPVPANAGNPSPAARHANVAAATPAVAASPVAKASVPAALAHTHRGLNRNLILLGSLALLMLGGLGIYLATRKGANTYNTKKNISNEIARNKFFTDLVASGATTAKELAAITDIRPLGIGFIGVSREKLTWEQAQALARRTASRILTIEPPKNASREPILAQLSDSYPDLRGSTVWVMENGEPKVMDGPNINPVTTLDRPRLVFVHWFARVAEKSPMAAPIISAKIPEVLNEPIEVAYHGLSVLPDGGVMISGHNESRQTRQGRKGPQPEGQSYIWRPDTAKWEIIKQTGMSGRVVVSPLNNNYWANSGFVSKDAGKTWKKAWDVFGKSEGKHVSFYTGFWSWKSPDTFYLINAQKSLNPGDTALFALNVDTGTMRPHSVEGPSITEVRAVGERIFCWVVDKNDTARALVSDDDAKTWKPVAPQETPFVLSMAVHEQKKTLVQHPRDPLSLSWSAEIGGTAFSSLMVCMSDPIEEGEDKSYLSQPGIFTSGDHGKTWVPALFDKRTSDVRTLFAESPFVSPDPNGHPNITAYGAPEFVFDAERQRVFAGQNGEWFVTTPTDRQWHRINQLPK